MSPVLTAHPTEVRRKSTLARELEIADLLEERARAEGDPAELAANEEKLRRAVLILWRTHMLRQQRLLVIDEVANGLSYYDYTFFRELPRLYGAIEDALDTVDPEGRGRPLPSFLRIGSWIGGDRDGNPYVTAEVLDEAMRQQSARALAFYLDELHQLGGELSLGAGLAPVTPSSKRSPTGRATRRKRAARSPTGGRSRASIPASPRPRASLIMSSRCASRSPTPRPTEASRNSSPTSTWSRLARQATAGRSSPAAACGR